jgi:hypothetical protein
VAGPQGRDPRRCSARGHMIMCGESAARASRVPSPVQACTGRRVAVVGACRGVAPFEFRVYTLVALYSRFNAHRDLLRQRRRGKLLILSHAFASEHAPVVACCTRRLPRDPVLRARSSVAVTVQGGCCLLFGPSVRSPLRCPLWPLWLTPWCQVSPLCRRGAVFAFAGLLITAILSC